MEQIQTTIDLLRDVASVVAPAISPELEHWSGCLPVQNVRVILNAVLNSLGGYPWEVSETLEPGEGLDTWEVYWSAPGFAFKLATDALGRFVISNLSGDHDGTVQA